MTMRRRLVVAAVATAAAGVCLWHLSPVVVGAAGSVLLIVSLVLLGVAQLAVERQRRRCRTRRLHGVTVNVRPGAGACTAGPLIPRVFVGAALLELLDDEELRAVVLHERAHRAHLDPLRSTIGRVARSVLYRARPEHHAGSVARREIRADRNAVARGASRSAIAAALLKVPALETSGVGFVPATELRVRALLGEDVPVTAHRSPLPALLSGSVVGVVACVRSAHAMAAVLVACCS